MLLFNLHRALENFAGENFFKTLLDPVPGDNVFFDYFLKLQMKKKTNCLFFSGSKLFRTSWGPNKKFKNVFNLKFSNTRFFFKVKNEDFLKFLKQISIFKDSVIKKKNCAARAPCAACPRNRFLCTVIELGSNVSKFENLKK